MPATQPSPSSRLALRPIFLLAVISLAYLLLFPLLFRVLGPAAGSLAVVPIMLAGWLFGRRAGLLSSLVIIGLTIGLRILTYQVDTPTVLRNIPGYVVLAGVGWVAGHMHELTARLRLELVQRQWAEAALAASQGRFQALIEHSSEGIGLFAADGTVTYTSPAAALILGAPADYWLGGNFMTRLHPDDAAEVRQLWTRVLAAPGTKLTAEFRYRHYDENWRWLEVTGTNWLRDPAVQAVVINFHDVTERHRATEVLLQAESQYRTLVEQIPAILYMAKLDETGTSLYNSPQIVRLGHTSAEYEADPELWLRSVHPDDRARVLAELSQMRLASGPFMAEYRVLHPDGRILWVQDEAVIVRDQAGQPLFQQGVVVDITARKEAEAALAAREQRFRGLIEHAPDAILLLTAAGQATYASPSTRQVLGYQPADLLNSDPLTLIHPEDLPGLQAQLSELMQRPGATVTAQYRFRRHDGAWCWLESNITNLLAEPSLAALVFNYRDITERRQHEHELQALVGVSAALRSAPNRAQMLTAVLSQVMAVMHLDGAALAFRDLSTGEVLVELSVGRWATTGLRLPAGEGISGLVIATGQPYVTPNVSADPRFADREHLATAQAIACVPLIVRHDSIGTLWAARDPEFSEGDVRLLTAMAEIAASAIQRITLLEVAEQGLERLTALRTIERAISNSLDLRLTLHILLEQIIGLLRVDAAVVLLLNADTQMLSISASRGLTASGRAQPEQRLGQGRAGRVALERRRLEVLDLAAEPAEPGSLPGEDFRAYIGLPLISKGEVQGVLEIYQRTPLAPTKDWRVFLEALAGQAAIAIDNAQLLTSLQDSNQQLTLAYDATIEGWSAALDLRDRETEGHSQRVTDLTLALAQAMGLGGDDLVQVRRGALLHDIGKMAVPDHILLKPGPLTDDEWVSMRHHPRSAYDLLMRIHYLHPALDIPYCHHEKWDGTGYPRGLKGPQIPLTARIFAVADVWDALCSDRPYRPAWPVERVRQYVQEQSGRHFDPAVVEVFMRLEASGLLSTSVPTTA
jgi:PAS domain S-box-containing protein/putative nucleotidyltransferase with HDIG domain